MKHDTKLTRIFIQKEIAYYNIKSHEGCSPRRRIKLAGGCTRHNIDNKKTLTQGPYV